MSIVVERTNGVVKTFATFRDAIDALITYYGANIVAIDASGVDCTDASQYPMDSDRVIVWEDEESSRNDHGMREVAEIYEVDRS